MDMNVLPSAIRGLSAAPDTENGSSIIVRPRDFWRSRYLSKS